MYAFQYVLVSLSNSYVFYRTLVSMHSGAKEIRNRTILKAAKVTFIFNFFFLDFTLYSLFIVCSVSCSSLLPYYYSSQYWRGDRAVDNLDLQHKRLKENAMNGSVDINDPNRYLVPSTENVDSRLYFCIRFKLS